MGNQKLVKNVNLLHGTKYAQKKQQPGVCEVSPLLNQLDDVGAGVPPAFTEQIPWWVRGGSVVDM